MFRYLHAIKTPINKVLKFFGIYTLVNIFIVKLFSKREKLSKKYIKGSGIEIGALHTPLKVFNKAVVRYVDRMTVAGLRKHYPELSKFHFMPITFVDDGERLKKVKDASQDFVIANHFIEHCENPIQVLKSHLRVLKNDGIIYWAIPDKRYTFDISRQLTSNEHLDSDYTKGPAKSRRAHYAEWVNVRYPELSVNEKKVKLQELLKAKYSIHYHVWTKETFIKFLKFVKRKYHFPFEVVENKQNINEFIVILRKK